MDHCRSWASWCKWVGQKSTYVLSDPNWITLGRLLHHPQSSLIYERGMIIYLGGWIWGLRETMTANTYLCPNMAECLVNGVGSNVLSWTLASVLIEASSISTEKGVRVFLLLLCRRTDAYPKVNGHRSLILCSKFTMYSVPLDRDESHTQSWPWGAPTLHYNLASELGLTWVSFWSRFPWRLIKFPRRTSPDLTTQYGDKAFCEPFLATNLPCLFHLSSFSHFRIVGQIDNNLKNTAFSYFSWFSTCLSPPPTTTFFKSTSELPQDGLCLLWWPSLFFQLHSYWLHQLLPSAPCGLYLCSLPWFLAIFLQRLCTFPLWTVTHPPTLP